jgi:agmatine deiminase
MSEQMPKRLGFIMPAEWEHHSAVWLAWPYDRTTFTKGIENAEKIFCEVIKSLEGSERVELIVLNKEMQTRAEKLLEGFGADLSNLSFHPVEFADVWTRDYGPFFIINRRQKDLAWVKWKYNAYGKSDDPSFNDFKQLLKDNEVFNIINPGEKKFTANMVLEGGAIEVNGLGSILTTKQTLLNPNRNPNLNRQQIENYLDDYLGAGNIIWLEKGLTNDHTDGHIDDIARFVSPGKILVAYEDNPQDENFEILDDNYQALNNAVDQDGKLFEIVKLPMPHMQYDDGKKAPVSYANFYIGNNVVLVPIFKDVNDEKALGIIQSCFPRRKVIGIDCKEIIYGGGAIHCMTQQQPAV